MQLCLTIIIFLFISGCASKAVQPDVTNTSGTSLSTVDKALEAQAQAMTLREEIIKKQTALPEETLKANKAKAQRILNAGHTLFTQGNYPKASRYFLKSIELDASQDQAYYEYGLTLYKQNNFAKSLTILNMLESTNVNQTELNYYQALCHYKMNNNDVALMKFKHTEEAKDEVLSPLAAMYAGLIEKSQENFDEAKRHFDYVLEFSKDPKMDQKAEDQIDSIIKAQQYIEKSKQKWGYSAFLGTGYDDNVLNAADVNAASNKAAYRFLYGGAVSYKALYNQKNSLIPQLWATDIYSLDDSFKADSTVQSSDPLQAEISAPYKHFFSKSTLTLSPSYQILVMSLNGGNRNQIYDSLALATTYTTSLAQDWVTNFRLDIAKDTFSIKDISADDDQSALKYTFLFSQTHMLNDQGTKSFTMDLLGSMNNAEGDNYQYTKFLLGLGGNFPIGRSERLLGYVRGDYFTMKFPSNSSDRSDSGLILSLGSGYTLSNRTTVSVNLQYYRNNSNVAIYDYDKFSLTAVYSFNNGFF